MGLDVRQFLQQMLEVLRPVVEAEPLPERGEIALDMARTPAIRLLYVPFETGKAQQYSRPAKFQCCVNSKSSGRTVSRGP